jgi:alpha-beta hydrolase superfamily lysophospholipase
MSDVLTFTDADGVPIAYRRWLPDGAARGIIQIAHGASEHSGRYDRFGSFLASRGYAAYANDHRGHGVTAEATGVGQAGPRGWEGMIDDVGELGEIARADVGAGPLILFGHSMGSFLAQLYAQRHGDGLAGLVLSGSAGAIDDHEGTIAGLTAFVDAGAGTEAAPLFEAFNTPFEPARTPFDWLSRDAVEVDRYIADPMCGADAPLTLAFALDMVTHLAEAWDPANEARIPTALPILLVTGEEDPVSDRARTVRELEARYRAQGKTDVTAHYYPGARHELLNETIRDGVEAEIADWLDRVTAG